MIEKLAPGGSALRHLLRDGVRKARVRGRSVLVSSSDRVPSLAALDFFELGRALSDVRFYWEQPDDEVALVGVGAASTLTLQGEERFGRATRVWSELLEGALLDRGSIPPEAGPILMGGFSFDPARQQTSLWRGFPAGLLVLPQFMLTRSGDTSWLTVNSLVDPESDPDVEAERLESALDRLRGPLLERSGEPEPHAAPSRGSDHWQRYGPGSYEAREIGAAPEDLRSPDSWKALVATATERIRQGDAEKIVLARAVRVLDGERLRPINALRRLRQASSTGCTLFAVGRRDRCFLGATPESLVRLRDGTVQVSSLAGTIGRGRNDAEDHQLGADLLLNAKDRAEHAVVVRTLQQQLAPFCVDLQAPAAPVLMKLPTVQHLYTPLTGRLISPQSVLKLVELLHPTPAIGGSPREMAMTFIREQEELDRGWYAGPVGWLDRHGEGEFAVAIRSALLESGQGTLFAGCGIMADSDPESEYRESCLKLESMLSILAGPSAP